MLRNQLWESQCVEASQETAASVKLEKRAEEILLTNVADCNTHISTNIDWCSTCSSFLDLSQTFGDTRGSEMDVRGNSLVVVKNIPGVNVYGEKHSRRGCQQ